MYSNKSDLDLWLRCRKFVRDQACGEWGEQEELKVTEKLHLFVTSELDRLWDALSAYRKLRKGNNE